MILDYYEEYNNATVVVLKHDIRDLQQNHVSKHKNEDHEVIGDSEVLDDSLKSGKSSCRKVLQKNKA